MNSDKIHKFSLAAESWLQSHPEVTECRIDVIAVIYEPNRGVTDLKHFRNAVEL